MSELYENANRLLNQEPRFTIILEYAPDSKVALTSHLDCAVPPGVPAIRNVVKEDSVKAVTQKIEPLKGTASIGNITVEVLNNSLGGVKTSNVPYLEATATAKPTAVLARANSSNPTAHITADRIAALGFSVYTAEVNTITAANCAPYDVVIVDCQHWSAGEHNTFIQDCYNLGYSVFVTGDDSGTPLFYVNNAVAETTKFHLEGYGAHQIEADVGFKWASINGAHVHITEWAAGMIPTVSFIGGGDCAGALWDNATGARLYHDQVGANTNGALVNDNLDNYLKNIMWWLGGHPIHYSAYSATSVFFEKLANGASLKNREVSIYRGFYGHGWDDYKQFQTQMIESVSYDKDVYVLSCYDVQRTTKTKIFSEKKAYLTSSMSLTQTFVPVSSYVDFEMIQHGPSYTDAPNATVGYVMVDKEVIRWSGTYDHPTLGPSLMVDLARPNGRGALGTAPAEHNVSSLTNDSQNSKVSEVIYIELPIVKIIHAILTGTPYGGLTPWPEHWTLSLDAKYVATSYFTSIGGDWWDPTDDMAGRIGRIINPSEVEGKKFIEKELLSLLGAFMPVLPDGSLGLRRVDRCLVNCPYAEFIDSSQFISRSALKYDTTQVANQFTIKWNYDFIQKELTRTNVLFDANSISVNSGTYDRAFEFKALSGSRHTLNSLQDQFSTLMDRYSYAPYTMQVTVPISVLTPWVGQVLRIQDDSLEDHITGTKLDRSMEVQRIQTDFGKGTHKLDLFGSTQTTAAQALSSVDVLTATFYSAGVDITTLPGVTNISGVYHVSSNLNLTGYGNLSFANAVISCPGPLEIDSGVTVTTAMNTQFRVQGHFQINGLLTSKGNGPDGATALLKCFKMYPTENCYFYTFEYPAYPGAATFGACASQGGVQTGDGSWVYRGARNSGVFASLPIYTLTNPDGNTLYGLPSSALGVGGCTGGHAAFNGGTSSDSFAKGGDGGAGGGGILIVSRGLDVGASGAIDSSGANGTVGANVGYSQAGGGAGGAPGGVIILLDGAVPYPTGLSRIRCVRGYSPYLGTPITLDQRQDHPGRLVCSAYEPDALYAIDQQDSMVRVQYVPPSVVAIPDANTYSLPVTGVTVTEFLNVPQTINQNLLTLEVDWTPPTDDTYLYADVYIKLATDTVWTYVDSGLDSVSTVLAADGTSYDLKVVSVNNFYVASPEYVEASTIVSTSAGFVSMETSNYISAFKTTFTDTTPGFWLGVDDSNWAKFNIGGLSNNLQYDSQTDILSVTGEIQAGSGLIGGWTINVDNIVSPDGLVELDATNSRLYAANATGTNWVRIQGDGIFAFDNTLGYTVKIPTDGTPPTFSSGTIQEFVYEMYTSGVIKTDIDPTLNGGVLINSAGLSVYDINGTRTAFLDGVDSNHEFTGSLTITGGDLPSSAENLIYDPGFFLKACESYSTWADHPQCVFGCTDGEYSTAGATITANTTIIDVYEGTYHQVSAGDVLYVKLRVKESVGFNAGGEYGFGLTYWDSSKSIPVTYDGIRITSDGASNQGVFQTYEAKLVVPSIVGIAYISARLTVRENATTGNVVFTSVGVSRVQQGADVTSDAVSSGVTITSGYIKRGTDEILLDFNNRRITVGGETYGSDGIQLEYNASNPRAYIGDGASNFIEYDGTSFVISGQFQSTGGATSQRIEINPGNDNQLHFYGDRGDTFITELATIGINFDGYGYAIGAFGNDNPGNSRTAVSAMSNSGSGVFARSISGDCVLVSGGSSTATGLKVNGTHGTGIRVDVAQANNGAFLVVQEVGTPPIVLSAEGGIPSTAPTFTAPIGTLWSTSTGILYIYTSTGWQKVGAQ